MKVYLVEERLYNENGEIATGNVTVFDSEEKAIDYTNSKIDGSIEENEKWFVHDYSYGKTKAHWVWATKSVSCRVLITELEVQ